MTDKHTLVERAMACPDIMNARIVAPGDRVPEVVMPAALRGAMANRIASLEAREAEMVKAMRYILPYLEWTIGKESPGHHPTMPSAVAEFRATLAKHQEGEGK